jgi:hypothetical protein
MAVAIELKSQFNEDYFSPRSDPGYKMSRLELFMAKRLYDEVRKVLELYPDMKFFKDIGLIKDEDFLAYLREGRILPEKSEHYFGNPHRLAKPKNIKRYGEFWTESVGGLSFFGQGEITAFVIFEKLARMTFEAKLRFGLVYYIEGGALKEPVIDVSNRKDLVYNIRLSNMMRIVPPFAISKNGGKTFVHYVAKKL